MTKVEDKPRGDLTAVVARDMWQKDLIKRAAELLRSPVLFAPYSHMWAKQRDGWDDQREQWLKDAGMDK